MFGFLGVGDTQGTAMDDRPLIITDDELVLDDLLRVAAAAGVEVTHTREPDSRALWRSAPLVLIDAALVPRAVGGPASPAAGVVMVAAPSPGSELWEHCVRLGVDRTLLLDRSEEVLIGLLSDAVAGGAGDGCCVAVLGACGGAGASVFASAWPSPPRAMRGEHGEVLLVDCDPWGAGLDVHARHRGRPGLALGRSRGADPAGCRSTRCNGRFPGLGSGPAGSGCCVTDAGR